MKQEMIVKTGEDGRIYSQTPLVRCKDCKYWKQREPENCGYCEEHNENHTGVWFCADGESQKESLHPIAPYLMVR